MVGPKIPPPTHKQLTRKYCGVLLVRGQGFDGEPSRTLNASISTVPLVELSNRKRRTVIRHRQPFSPLISHNLKTPYPRLF